MKNFLEVCIDLDKKYPEDEKGNEQFGKMVRAQLFNEAQRLNKSLQITKISYRHCSSGYTHLGYRRKNALKEWEYHWHLTVLMKQPWHILEELHRKLKHNSDEAK